MDEKLRQITDIYGDYIRWSAEHLASYGGIRMFSQLFNGGGEYKNRGEHAEFMSALTSAAEELLPELAAPGGREALMPLLRWALIDCHSRCDDWAEWMLLAAEKHFIPCLELLSPAEARELYEPYRRLRRKNRGLPPQDQILRQLKTLSRK